MKKLMIAALLFMASTLAQAKAFKVTLTESNTISMRDYFYWGSVAKVAAAAKKLDNLPTKAPIYLIIDSGGGSISAGLEMIENLKNLRRPVRTITLFAASMGFQTVQGLGPRLIQIDGTLMSHKASGMFWGEFPGQIDSRYSFWLKRVNELDRRSAARTKGKYSLKSYQRLIENEYWCQGKDCLKNGFADALVNAKCGKSLAGTEDEVDQFFYDGYRIELIWTKDKCPLNTGILKFDIQVTPLFPEREAGPSEATNRSIMEKVNKLHQDKLDNMNRVVRKGY